MALQLRFLSESARLDKSLRRLVLLRCTLDTNGLQLQTTSPKALLETNSEALVADASDGSSSSDDWDDSDDFYDSDCPCESEYPDGFDKWSVWEASKDWKLPQALDTPDTQVAGHVPSMRSHRGRKIGIVTKQ
jgi:hypothetical protein